MPDDETVSINVDTRVVMAWQRGVAALNATIPEPYRAGTLEQSVANLVGASKRWERPAARLREMRKAVEGLKNPARTYTAMGDAGFYDAIRIAIETIDRIAGSDVPEESAELAELKQDVDDLRHANLMNGEVIAERDAELAELRKENAELREQVESQATIINTLSENCNEYGGEALALRRSKEEAERRVLDLERALHPFATCGNCGSTWKFAMKQEQPATEEKK